MTLTGSESPFQSEIEQVIAAQNAVIASNTAYPFITDFDRSLLPQYVQMVATGQLFNTLGKLNLDTSIDQNGQWAPYPWNAPGTDPITEMNIAVDDGRKLGQMRR
ncbi:hypothetical protein CIW47_26080 [Mycolicibacterium sp. P1-5]|nr:hypothetical protein CIW47_26080 [Mycolicibacterium sp. P1-5]